MAKKKGYMGKGMLERAFALGGNNISRGKKIGENNIGRGLKRAKR